MYLQVSEVIRRPLPAAYASKCFRKLAPPPWSYTPKTRLPYPPRGISSPDSRNRTAPAMEARGQRRRRWLPGSVIILSAATSQSKGLAELDRCLGFSGCLGREFSARAMGTRGHAMVLQTAHSQGSGGMYAGYCKTAWSRRFASPPKTPSNAIFRSSELHAPA